MNAANNLPSQMKQQAYIRSNIASYQKRYVKYLMLAEQTTPAVKQKKHLLLTSQHFQTFSRYPQSTQNTIRHEAPPILVDHQNSFNPDSNNTLEYYDYHVLSSKSQELQWLDDGKCLTPQARRIPQNFQLTRKAPQQISISFQKDSPSSKPQTAKNSSTHMSILKFNQMRNQFQSVACSPSNAANSVHRPGGVGSEK